MLKYISYQMQVILKKSERQGLEKNMRIIVTLQRLPNKVTDPSIKTDAEDEINSMASFPVSIW
jgi:hypothetical protein